MQERKRPFDVTEVYEMGDKSRLKPNNNDERKEDFYLQPYQQSLLIEEKKEEYRDSTIVTSIALRQTAVSQTNEIEVIDVVSSSSSFSPISSPSGIVRGTLQHTIFGQLARRDQDRHLTLSVPGGDQPVWKQPKPFHQRLDKLNGLNQQQTTLACLIRDKLLSALTLCHHIADGNCYDVTWVNSSRTLDMIQAAGAAGGLLPIIGGSIVFGNLVFSALRTGLREFNQYNVISRAKLVKAFVPNFDDMLLLSSNVAVVIAIAYCQPLTKLNDDGLTVFANYLVNRMVHHIATNRGVDDGYLKSIGNAVIDTAVNLFKSVVRSIDSSMFPIRDRDDGPREKIILESIFCFSPGFSARTPLNRRYEYQDHNDYTIEGILSTGIVTPEGKYFSNHDAQPEKYGYRFLSQEYAESIGYALSRQQFQSDTHSHYNIY